MRIDGRGALSMTIEGRVDPGLFFVRELLYNAP
jgi:hypothetical protein